jgi:hypothetical protein
MNVGDDALAWLTDLAGPVRPPGVDSRRRSEAGGPPEAGEDPRRDGVQGAAPKVAAYDVGRCPTPCRDSSGPRSAGAIRARQPAPSRKRASRSVLRSPRRRADPDSQGVGPRKRRRGQGRQGPISRQGGPRPPPVVPASPAALSATGRQAGAAAGQAAAEAPRKRRGERAGQEKRPAKATTVKAAAGRPAAKAKAPEEARPRRRAPRPRKAPRTLATKAPRAEVGFGRWAPAKRPVGGSTRKPPPAAAGGSAKAPRPSRSCRRTSASPGVVAGGARSGAAPARSAPPEEAPQRGRNERAGRRPG